MADNLIGGALQQLKPAGMSFGGMPMFLVILIGILVLALLGTITYFIATKIMYNNKVVLFRKVGNKTMLIGDDWGKVERISADGTHWLRTKRFKKVVQRPTFQMGFVRTMFGLKPIYWFLEREDGMWQNFDLGDIDEELKKAGVHYIHEDMRLSQVTIGNILKSRHKPEGFFARHGDKIVFIIFAALMMVMVIITISQGVKFMGVAKDVTAKQGEVIVKLDNILSQGRSMSGLLFLLPFRRLKRWLQYKT